MSEGLVNVSPHDANGKITVFMTGMSSPISQAVMREMSPYAQFVGTASSEASVQAVGTFMRKNGVAGGVYGWDLGSLPTDPAFNPGHTTEVEAWYEEAVEAHGEPDAVMYNAGVANAEPLHTYDSFDILSSLNVNVGSAIVLARISMEALAAARSRDERLGAFVYATTLGATHPLTDQELYAAGNSGMDGFVRAAAMQEMRAERPDAEQIAPLQVTPLAEDKYVKARAVRLGPVDGGGMFVEHAPVGMQGAVNQLMKGKPFTLLEAARSMVAVTFGRFGSMEQPIYRSTGGFVNQLQHFKTVDEPEIPREFLSQAIEFNPPLPPRGVSA